MCSGRPGAQVRVRTPQLILAWGVDQARPPAPCKARRHAVPWTPSVPPGMQPVPRDADRIMSGNCGVVAIWVTQPLWPLRVPRRVICSVMTAADASVAGATRMALDSKGSQAPQRQPRRPRGGKERAASAGTGNTRRARRGFPRFTAAHRWWHRVVGGAG